MPVKKITKKVVKKSRINPPLVKTREKDFENLNPGDCFLDNTNDLLIKTNDDDQSAVSLLDGEMYENLCYSQVTPVEITVNWKRKK